MNKDILEIAKKIENEGGRLYLVGRSCKRQITKQRNKR